MIKKKKLGKLGKNDWKFGSSKKFEVYLMDFHTAKIGKEKEKKEQFKNHSKKKEKMVKNDELPSTSHCLMLNVCNFLVDLWLFLFGQFLSQNLRFFL